jgi:4-hydroxybenzoate polyprenyltransferase
MRGLIAACHPGPTLVVTSGLTVLAAALGVGPRSTTLVFLAILTGQLSIGWANDAHDAASDSDAGRSEKPVVRGWISSRSLWVAAWIAVTLCIPLSIAAGGLIGGLAHVTAVASAWAYDLWLKTTLWSFLPYAVSFGLLAPFLTHSLTPAQPAAPWSVAALSLLGVGAHLANGIPDIDADRRSATEGLVAHLGRRWAALLCVGALLGAATLVVGQLDLPPMRSVALLTGAAAVLAIAAIGSGGRHLFPAVMLLGLGSALLLTLNASAMVAG